MNIFVGGVNGSGKTTVLESIGALRPDWLVTKSSQAFMEWLGFPGDYARLQQLNPDERDAKLTEFMHIVTERGEKTPCQLLDSHYLNLKHGKTECVTGPWLKNFDALVLISTSASTIVDRLQGDERLHHRALFTEGTPANQQLSLLQEYIKATEKAFFSLAQQFHLPHIKIENFDKNQAANDLTTFVEGLREDLTHMPQNNHLKSDQKSLQRTS